MSWLDALGIGGGTSPGTGITGPGAAGLTIPGVSGVPVPGVIGVPHTGPGVTNTGGGNVAVGSAGTSFGAGTPLPLTLPAQAPSSAAWGDFVKWGGAFAVMSVVLVMGANSPKYGDVAVALAWVIAIGAAFYWYDAADLSVASLLGQQAVLPTGLDPNLPYGKQPIPGGG